MQSFFSKPASPSQMADSAGGRGGSTCQVSCSFMFVVAVVVVGASSPHGGGASSPPQWATRGRGGGARVSLNPKHRGVSCGDTPPSRPNPGTLPCHREAVPESPPSLHARRR